jgi:hypothetical protein
MQTIEKYVNGWISAVPLTGILPVAGIDQIPARLFLLLKCLKRG